MGAFISLSVTINLSSSSSFFWLLFESFVIFSTISLSVTVVPVIPSCSCKALTFIAVSHDKFSSVSKMIVLAGHLTFSKTAEPHSSVGSVADLRTGDRWFDLQARPNILYKD